mgnify:CR=1 FL=1
MKKIFILLISGVLFYGTELRAQEREESVVNAYLAESETYFRSPLPVSGGILLSNNYESAVWLLQQGQLHLLIEGPGCGRYLRVSPGGTSFIYKNIRPDGKQQNMLYDLNTFTTEALHEALPRCGQADFCGDRILYSNGKSWCIRAADKTEETSDADYANWVRCSPDGSLICYSDPSDEIIVSTPDGQERRRVSPGNTACYYPQWSPDGRYILFEGVGPQLYVYDLSEDKLIALGEGVQASWSPDSRQLVFVRIQARGDLLLSSDLFLASADGHRIEKVSGSEAIHEMDPVFADDSHILYHSYNRREIRIMEIRPETTTLVSDQVVYRHQGTLPFEQALMKAPALPKSTVMVPGSVPYIHQVYDTPDWHYGSGSCAPTTAMMAIAYFNKLPKWPMTSSWPTPHTSDYGQYVADRYRFNEIYYADVAQTGGGEDAWGGYGYMWTGSYSPNSRMNQYMLNHQLGSIQYWTTGCKWDSTKYEIDHGWPQPICSMLTGAGHLTLAIGYNDSLHYLVFHDPYGNKNNGYINYNGQNACYDWPGYNNGFQSLNSVAWTVKADGEHKVYNDTLIDDIDYNHGFFMANQPPSQMRYYRDETSSCYNGHYWWTYSNPSLSLDTCWVSWTPSLAQAGLYEVFVYIPGTYATATSARYRIFFAGGDTTVVIDQSSYGNVWVSLGIHSFNAGTAGYVRLGDATGIQGQYLAFDAMKWQKVITTGTTETDEAGFRIYPNPASDEIHIVAEKAFRSPAIVRLCNCHGQLVLEREMITCKESKRDVSISLSGMTDGFYYVEILGEDFRIREKIIVFN